MSKKRYFQSDIDRYAKANLCYWVMLDNKQIGGALIKANMLKCIFTIPPFHNYSELINVAEGNDAEAFYDKLGLKVKSRQMIGCTHSTAMENYTTQVSSVNSKNVLLLLYTKRLS